MLTLALLLSLAVPLEEDPVFVEGRALFQELELEQAAIRFEQVSLDTSRAADERALVLTWLGVCQAKVGAFEPARASFDLAVRLKRDIALPVEVSPRVVQMLEEARAAAPEVSDDRVEEPLDEPIDDTSTEEPPPLEEPDEEPVLEDPADEDPVDNTPPPPAGDPTLSYVLGGTAAVTGAVALASFGFGAIAFVQAADLSKTQVEAVAIHQTGVVATVGGAIAAGVAVASGAFALMSWPE